LGVLSDEIYQEGSFDFGKGDTLVVYSDGLIDALPEQSLDNEALADVLNGTKSAEEMVEKLTGLVPPEVSVPDDLTVMVLHCQ
jgi:serine phosphatase RsbU (regulator of sigma subunit)